MEAIIAIQQHPYKYNHAQHLFEQTQIERKRIQELGSEELTVDELNVKLLALGFKIHKPDSFTYTNNLNSVTYKAYSCFIIDIKTKVHFCNHDFCMKNRERVDELQKLRRNHYAYCYKTHSIYEL